MNGKSIALMVRLRDEYENGSTPIVISGCVGPQDDGYNPAVKMSSAEAQAYHATQIETFVRSPVDMVTAITMTYVDEAVGITRAAQQAELPVAISVHLGNGWTAAQQAGTVRGYPGGRRGNEHRSRLLHDQLRASDTFRLDTGRRAVAAEDPWSPGERIEDESR